MGPCCINYYHSVMKSGKLNLSLALFSPTHFSPLYLWSVWGLMRFCIPNTARDQTLLTLHRSLAQGALHAAMVPGMVSKVL